jgi:hypothetical protein
VGWLLGHVSKGAGAGLFPGFGQHPDGTVDPLSDTIACEPKAIPLKPPAIYAESCILS